MEELDYEPNAMARGLARRRSYTLAMSFPEFDTAMGETVFGIVRGAQRAAAELGYHLAVWPVSWPRSCARARPTACCWSRSPSLTPG